MALILNIDVSASNASICLSSRGVSIGLLENADQKDHAAWLHPAIEKLLKQAGARTENLNAVAVTAGPGSYTGLRVGLSAAKGLCFALNIPLITENSLRVMALAMAESFRSSPIKENILFCPMIDARRMEVFSGVFDQDLLEVVQSNAFILSNDIFAGQLEKGQIIFSGNGSIKSRPFITHPHAVFREIAYSAIQLGTLSYQKFLTKSFDDIAYSEPLYLKEFYTLSKR